MDSDWIDGDRTAEDGALDPCESRNAAREARDAAPDAEDAREAPDAGHDALDSAHPFELDAPDSPDAPAPIVTVRFLMSVARATERAGSLEAGLDDILDALCDFGGFPIAHVVRYLRDNGVSRARTSHGWHGPRCEAAAEFRRATEARFDGGEELPESEPAGRAYRTRDGVVHGEASALAAERRTAAVDAGIGRVYTFAVSAEGEIAALVELFGGHGPPIHGSTLQTIGFVNLQLNRLASRDRAKAAVRKAASHCRRLAEQLQPTSKQLREMEERYSLICRATNEGLWDWDLRADRVFYSPRWKALLGFGARDLDHEPGVWFDRIHPEDRERVEQELLDHLEWRSERFESRHRIRHADGSYRLGLVRAVAVHDEDGKPYRLAGSLRLPDEETAADETTAEKTPSPRALCEPRTGLPSRALLLDRLHQAMKRRSRRPDRAYAVLAVGLAELEGFQHSHRDEIEELSRSLARRATAALRPGDTFGHDGEGDFGVVLDDVDDLEDTQRIAGRLHATLGQPVTLGEQEVALTPVIGVALGRASYERPEEVLRDARLALRRARKRGLELQVFDAATAAFVQSTSELEPELREAFEKRRLHLEYQPIVSLDDGRISGMEAFIRWAHRERGSITAEQLLLVAEEAGLLEKIGYWVLRSACQQLSEWIESLSLRFPPVIAVNVPERQFFAEEFVGRALSTVDATGLDPRLVRLDVSETALGKNGAHAERVLAALAEKGLQTAIDDFGTGCSSLSHLHRLRVSTLKIDRAFVSGEAGASRGWDVARTIVQLAENLDLDVIAEGIETSEQFERLRTLGCRQAQGYFFSGPVPADRAAALIRDGYPLDLEAPSR